MCNSGQICLIALSWAHFVRMLAGSSGGCPKQLFSRKGMKSQTQRGRWPLTACLHRHGHLLVKAAFNI